MAAGVAEDLDEEVGGAVDDGRLLLEVGLAVDEAVDLDDALDAVEAADFVSEARDQADGRKSGSVGSWPER